MAENTFKNYTCNWFVKHFTFTFPGVTSLKHLCVNILEAGWLWVKKEKGMEDKWFLHLFPFIPVAPERWPNPQQPLIMYLLVTTWCAHTRIVDNLIKGLSRLLWIYEIQSQRGPLRRPDSEDLRPRSALRANLNLIFQVCNLRRILESLHSAVRIRLCR